MNTSCYRWILKCHACSTVTAEIGRIFCPKCGNAGTLRKVAVTVNENGIVLAARRPRITLRGTKVSIPSKHVMTHDWFGSLFFLFLGSPVISYLQKRSCNTSCADILALCSSHCLYHKEEGRRLPRTSFYVKTSCLKNSFTQKQKRKQTKRYLRLLSVVIIVFLTLFQSLTHCGFVIFFFAGRRFLHGR